MTFNIGLGVTGGIAAYKAVEVLRLLQKAGCDVTVAMTRHATEFVQPLTFRALTDRHVIVDDYDPANPDPIAHINFSQNIDLLLIVPATANIIAKFANGVADDFLSSTYLATTAPVIIAPAMNVTMWEQPATQRNVEQLRADGVHFVDPVAGELACKTVGTGKLEDVENIVSQALRLLNAKTQRGKDAKADLAGEKLLITVGGTREAIDPVRFISNHSSGKMGFALAAAAADRAASVTVVAGVTTVEPPSNVNVIRAVSAEQMHEAVMKELPSATIFVGAAAVADYAPANAADAKIKKEGRDTMTLELKKTPDILADVSRNRHDGLMVVGFAAETNDVVGYARSKMEKKGLDIVVANDITKEGAGFNTDTNIATIITHTTETELPLISKRELGDRILDEVIRLRQGQSITN
ncbi:MAG: bifunctional phosphopantothenoylcysteine decarboxylase/phosphopantothenate--cysteine ligase CoaBC [Acidobacteria bacterium]|nr:bifunctional phosphopantothenoylcysteine decarboxylase/phosphopantothenate--cysteine ligase CoaBC [Acidobacteriota bacterium]MBK9527443.1 bifunctional phosphopantothenoylcysteine decarboxylase/phosphopantothenate--cysteine ligase CoaBC [Acidobacteriota bacterium]MBP7474129.1 bifunctional phosphopantothenoylcysteine decarboxylase/phosphopantothenate--cysteine ligase CoaBC [Pyrinomonadaceae bacterium]MBP9108541.1 bifunctional phosphopantothenoylcysteine decarboxylase/phosphopantothenate--cystei